MGKESPTSGVKPMTISGRYVNERERLLGMTDAERAFRKQWLKDQELAPTEPRNVPEMYKFTHNSIRRFYRWPLDQLQKTVLVPALGQHGAEVSRLLIGKLSIGLMLVYFSWYTIKYHGNEWERRGGWSVKQSRDIVLPGDPGYPKLSDRVKPADYGCKNFRDFNGVL